MKSQDLIKHHQSSDAELAAAIRQLRLDLAETKLQLKLGQLKNLHAYKTMRQDLAKLLTIQRQRQLASPTASPSSASSPVKSSNN